MKIYPNKFCVYTHSVNGVVFYVGKGRGYRALESSRRNYLWIEAVENAGSFDVDIVSWHDADADARLAETLLIRSLSPACNKLCHPEYAGTDNQKIAASLANKGKVVSVGTRSKISFAMKGRSPHNKGNSATESQKASQRAAHAKTAKPVVCVSTGEAFESTKHAARLLSIPASTLRAHLSGTLSHAGGMEFRYA